MQNLKTARELAADIVGGDPSNVPVCHPIRWPGSWHRKNKDEPTLCQIETLNPETEIDLASALRALRAAPGSSNNKAAGNGHDQQYSGDDNWQELIAGILTGDDFHNASTKLAMKLLLTGMKDAAAVNLIRAWMNASSATRNNRFRSRYNDIPRAVSTAREKIGQSNKTEAEQPATADGEQQNETAPQIKILSSAEFILSYVAPDYLIEGLLQRQFFYSLTGKTGAGKTALALLFAALVALARTMDGRQFERGRVLYLAGENPVDVQQRWIAMSQQMDFDGAAIDVHFIPGVFKVSEMKATIAEEVEKLGGVALVVIDTSAAYFEGDDENSNVQAGNYARMQRELIKSLPGGPTILALCHPVKNAGEDNLLPRGGGSYLNETDGNLTAWNDDGVVELHWQGKFRGADFAPISFQLRKVTHELLKDSKGRLISTVVAAHLSEAGAKELRKITRNNENEVLRILADVEGLSLVEIAERAGWVKDGKPNKSAVFRMVRKLKTAKLVRQGRSGPELTDAGRKAVKGKTAEENDNADS